MHEFSISRCKVISIAQRGEKEIIDYGVRMVGAPLEWPETEGEGVRVGVIDTGVDADHPDIKGRIRDCANFSGGSILDIEDDNGHGTHIIGIVGAERNGIGTIGVAPKADIFVAKAFGKDGKTDYPAIEKSIRWLWEKNVDVINMSFSSQFTSPRYRLLIRETHDRGISVICAAGNEGELGSNTIGYPANFAETVAVSAVDINKNIAEFSSRGKAAEICAAGKDVYSTYLNGGYATLSGTSMACPIITGAVALLQAKGYARYGRRLKPEEIRLLLNIYTENPGVHGRDLSYGYGIFSFGRIASEDYIYSHLKTGVSRSDIATALILSMIK